MRLKKVMSLVLSGLVATSLVACGSSTAQTSASKDQGNGKIVVWTLSDDLKTFC